MKRIKITFPNMPHVSAWGEGPIEEQTSHADLTVDPLSRGFDIPPRGCLEGSAWHTWQRQGAYYATRNHHPACLDAAAHTFAEIRSGCTYGNAYEALRRAFLSGAKGN